MGISKLNNVWPDGMDKRSFQIGGPNPVGVHLTPRQAEAMGIQMLSAIERATGTPYLHNSQVLGKTEGFIDPSLPAKKWPFERPEGTLPMGMAVPKVEPVCVHTHQKAEDKYDLPQAAVDAINEAGRERNRKEGLCKSIQDAINRACAENASDTPDFILADYLMDCLAAWDNGTKRRTEWYRPPEPVCGVEVKADSAAGSASGVSSPSPERKM